MRARRIAAAILLVALAAAALWLSWDPYPKSRRVFDRSANGLWLGHKWYTGRHVRGGTSVSEEEFEALVATLARQRIRYAYVHAGPVLADGSLADSVAPLFSRLRHETPGVLFLAWIGARVENVPLAQPDWRERVVSSARRLRSEGFDGVHLDFEPLRNGEPGYLDLLQTLRVELGRDFTISQATPRASPIGLSFGSLQHSFWSESFYRESMRRSDQTVLMAYDSHLSFSRGYVEFVRWQTSMLLHWACSVPGHELLIGIPSYEDVPIYSDPQVENLRTASLGVRSALERWYGQPDCFRGVAIYANWVTDAREWRQFERFWTAAAAPDD